MPCFFLGFLVFRHVLGGDAASLQALPPSVGGLRKNILDHIPVLPLQVAGLLLDEGLRLA